MITNTKTKKIRIGSLAIGGGEPIRIQSMTNTKTYDVEATVSQIQRRAVRSFAPLCRIWNLPSP